MQHSEPQVAPPPSHEGPASLPGPTGESVVELSPAVPSGVALPVSVVV
jgi:hypothetical protein